MNNQKSRREMGQAISVDQQILAQSLRPTLFRSLLFPSEIRKAIYITNAIESMNSSLRKVIKSQQIFPSDDAACNLVYLAMRNISKKWTMPIKDWKPALNRFAILFEDRLHL